MFATLTQRVINYFPDVERIKELTIYQSLGFIEFEFDSHWLRVEWVDKTNFVSVHERVGMQPVETDFTKSLERILNSGAYYD